jgi:hypothetical protein
MPENLREWTCKEFQNQIAELVGSGAEVEKTVHWMSREHRLAVSKSEYFDRL